MTDQYLHSAPATRAADELVAVAGAFKVLWVSRFACTHVEEGWIKGKVRRDIFRGESRTFDWVKRPSTFGGRDSESCCDGGSAEGKDDKT